MQIPMTVLMCGRLLLWIMFLTTAAHPCYAQVTLRIEALSEVVPAGYARVKSHGPAVDEIDIALGDPIGFKAVLRNEADTETEPMPKSLNPIWNPAIVVITHPDGRTTSLGPLDDPTFRVAPMIGSMKPREQLEAYLYTYTDMAEELDRRLEYIFSGPGEHQIYMAYFTRLPKPTGGEGEDWTSQVLDRIARRDGVIVSNAVTVNVGPPILGWEELREAGIVGAVRTGIFPALLSPDVDTRESATQRLDTLVAQANRPWLTDFYERAKKSALQGTRD